MTEPATTAAGGIALYKMGAFFGLMAVLAAIVVMAMTLPKSPREFIVATVSTVVASLGGGAFIVRWFEIAHWVGDEFGLVAIGGVMFVCGLPAWVLVRGWFAYAESARGRTLLEMIRDIREATGR